MGSGLNYFQNSTLQGGQTMGGLFRPLFRTAALFFKSGAKVIGKKLFRSCANVINDLSCSKNIKLFIKWRLKEADQTLRHQSTTILKTMISRFISSGHSPKKKNLSNRTVIRKAGENTQYLQLKMSRLISKHSTDCAKSELD